MGGRRLFSCNINGPVLSDRGSIYIHTHVYGLTISAIFNITFIFVSYHISYIWKRQYAHFQFESRLDGYTAFVRPACKQSAHTIVTSKL